jgi:hypothetical protein
MYIKSQEIKGGKLAKKAVILITIFNNGERRLFIAFFTAQITRNPAPTAIKTV